MDPLHRGRTETPTAGDWAKVCPARAMILKPEGESRDV